MERVDRCELGLVRPGRFGAEQPHPTRQFWGDYNTLVSTNANAFFIYTDSRNGVGCPAVDAFQHGTSPTPAPGTDCGAQFGNTDAFVSRITP